MEYGTSKYKILKSTAAMPYMLQRSLMGLRYRKRVINLYWKQTACMEIENELSEYTKLEKLRGCFPTRFI